MTRAQHRTLMRCDTYESKNEACIQCDASARTYRDERTHDS